MRVLSIVEVEGLKTQYVVIKAELAEDGWGGFKINNKIAKLDDFKKYGIGALTTTYSDAFLKEVGQYV